MRINFESIVGFLIPLCIFLDPTSNIVLANSSLTESNTAIPISLLVSPLIIIYALTSKVLDKNVYFWGVILSLFFVGWCLVLAILSAISYSYVSFLYAFQWIYPVIWFFYFLTLSDNRKLDNFIKGFYLGAYFNAFYIFLAGVLEIILFGGLQDQGRVSQNLILPGHYQMYVYMPTLVAYSTLIIVLLKNSNFLKIEKTHYFIFIIVSTLSVIFLGAREAILVLFLGFIFLYGTKSINHFLKTFFLCIGLIAMVLTFLSLIKGWGESGEIRILTKLMNLGDEGKQFGGRDNMAEIYLNIINQDKLFGTQILPGQIVFPYLGEFAPSAHNYYIDSWAWLGFFGFLLVFCSLLLVLFQTIVIFLKNKSYFNINLLFLMVLFIFVSLFLNVPLRQPLTAPILFLLFGLVIYSSKSGKV